MGKKGSATPKRKRGRPAKVKPPERPADLTKATPHIEELLTRERLGKGNIKLLERAVEWPISRTLREKILRRMGKLVESDNEKVAVAASRVVVAADNVNVRREGNAINSEKPGSQVNVSINIEATQQQAELAALAAEIRAGRVFESIHPAAAIVDCLTDGEASDSSGQGQDRD